MRQDIPHGVPQKKKASLSTAKKGLEVTAFAVQQAATRQNVAKQTLREAWRKAGTFDKNRSLNIRGPTLNQRQSRGRSASHDR